MSPHFIVAILVLSALSFLGVVFVGPFVVISGLVALSTIVIILIVSMLVAFITILYVIGTAAAI